MLVQKNSKLHTLVKEYKIAHKELIEFKSEDMIEAMCGYMEIGDVTMIKEAFETLKALGKELPTDLVPVFHALGYELGYEDADIIAIYLEK